MSIPTFDFGTFSIVNSPLGSGDNTFQVAATKANQKGNDDYYEFPDTSIVNFYLTIEEKGGAKKEKVGIASLVDSGSDLADGRNIYTLTFRKYSDGTTNMRGVKPNSDGTNNISNQDTDLIVSSFPVGSLVKMVWNTDYQASLEAAFSSASNTETVTANGTITAGTAIYLNSSGEAVQGVNSGAFDGIATTSATAGNPVTYARFVASGITVPGNIGDSIYSTSGGVLTTTSTGNTRIGRKQGSSTLAIFNQEIYELTQANAEDETSTQFGLVSGERLDQFVVDSTKVVHTTGAESVAGVKTFTDSPIVPNGATGTDAINAGEVDTKISSRERVSAYLSSAFNVTSTLGQKVTGWTEIVDSGSDFASDTFTAPVAGDYKVSISGQQNAGNSVSMAVRVNATTEICGYNMRTNADLRFSDETIVTLAQNDTLEVWADRPSTNTLIEGGTNYTENAKLNIIRVS